MKRKPIKRPRVLFHKNVPQHSLSHYYISIENVQNNLSQFACRHCSVQFSDHARLLIHFDSLKHRRNLDKGEMRPVESMMYNHSVQNPLNILHCKYMATGFDPDQPKNKPFTESIGQAYFIIHLHDQTLYVCISCWQRYKTYFTLKKHFKSLIHNEKARANQMQNWSVSTLSKLVEDVCVQSQSFVAEMYVFYGGRDNYCVCRLHVSTEEFKCPSMKQYVEEWETMCTLKVESTNDDATSGVKDEPHVHPSYANINEENIKDETELSNAQHLPDLLLSKPELFMEKSGRMSADSGYSESGYLKSRNSIENLESAERYPMEIIHPRSLMGYADYKQCLEDGQSCKSEWIQSNDEAKENTLAKRSRWSYPNKKPTAPFCTSTNLASSVQSSQFYNSDDFDLKPNIENALLTKCDKINDKRFPLGQLSERKLSLRGWKGIQQLDVKCEYKPMIIKVEAAPDQANSKTNNKPKDMNDQAEQNATSFEQGETIENKVAVLTKTHSAIKSAKENMKISKRKKKIRRPKSKEFIEKILFQCKQCAFKSPLRFHLQRHVKSKHSIQSLCKRQRSSALETFGESREKNEMNASVLLKKYSVSSTHDMKFKSRNKVRQENDTRERGACRRAKSKCIQKIRKNATFEEKITVLEQFNGTFPDHTPDENSSSNVLVHSTPIKDLLIHINCSIPIKKLKTSKTFHKSIANNSTFEPDIVKSMPDMNVSELLRKLDELKKIGAELEGKETRISEVLNQSLAENNSMNDSSTCDAMNSQQSYVRESDITEVYVDSNNDTAFPQRNSIIRVKNGQHKQKILQVKDGETKHCDTLVNPMKHTYSKKKKSMNYSKTYKHVHKVKCRTSNREKIHSGTTNRKRSLRSWKYGEENETFFPSPSKLYITHIFVCESCEYSTSIWSDIRDHVLREHRDKFPYWCDYCPFACIDETLLTQHLKYFHVVVFHNE